MPVIRPNRPAQPKSALFDSGSSVGFDPGINGSVGLKSSMPIPNPLPGETSLGRKGFFAFGDST